MHSSVATVNPASDTKRHTASFNTFRLGSAILIKTKISFYYSNFDLKVALENLVKSN